MVPLEHVIGLSAILFCIGLVGVVLRRNLIAILMSIEIMRGGGALAFVAWNRAWPGGPTGVGEPALDGQLFALIGVAIAAAEVVVGLAILISMLGNRDSLDAEDASLLKW